MARYAKSIVRADGKELTQITSPNDKVLWKKPNLVEQDAKNVVFRPTGATLVNGAWQKNLDETHYAVIDKIKGNTIVWNQLAKLDFTSDIDFVNGIKLTKINDYTLKIEIASTGITSNRFVNITSVISWTQGHKYIIGGSIPYINGISTYAYNVMEAASGERIISAQSTILTQLQLALYTNTSHTQATYYMTINVSDLTQMFGDGNEPSTVEEFKAMFPLDYYEYNTGELISFNGTGLKTVGFNLFDKSTVVVGQLETDGTINSYFSNRRTSDFIPCFSDTTYYISNGVLGEEWYCFGFYDSNKNIISLEGVLGGTGTKITPSNCAYMRVTCEATKLDSCCVNMTWSGIRNGEYEPYWESTLDLPIQQYFPDGMKEAGSVADEMTKDKAIKRIEKIDFGDQSYSNNWGGKIYDIELDSDNIVCANFIYQPNGLPGSLLDKHFTIATGHHMFFRDDACYDATAFKNAYSGVYFYLELASPIETPINPPLNLTYKCDDFGTEMLLPQNDDEPITAPMNADITYAEVG